MICVKNIQSASCPKGTNINLLDGLYMKYNVGDHRHLHVHVTMYVHCTCSCMYGCIVTCSYEKLASQEAILSFKCLAEKMARKL